MIGLSLVVVAVQVQILSFLRENGFTVYAFDIG
jgi:hypothetical protein